MPARNAGYGDKGYETALLQSCYWAGSRHSVFGAISACGGAGGGLDVADGGIRGTGSSVGPVSGFGSVFVNGVEFSTDDIPNREVESNDGITAEGLLS